jgi:hypothetical protein
MSQSTIANYIQEQAQFKQLVESSSGPNILMFRGASGSGKSHLIEHCLKSVEHIPVAQLKLQSGGETIPTLFNVVGAKIGRQKLPLFSKRVAGLAGDPPEADDALWRMQLRRHLRKIGRNSDLNTRKD